MTAIHRQTHAPRPLPLLRGRSPAAPPSVASITFSWDILPDLPNLAPLVPTTSLLSQARLVIFVRGQTVHPFVELTHKGAASPIRSLLSAGAPPATLSFQEPASPNAPHLAHLHAPGVLTATIAFHRDHPPRVLYARTPLLRSLGFPGGAYDRPAAAWELASAPQHESE